MITYPISGTRANCGRLVAAALTLIVLLLPVEVIAQEKVKKPKPALTDLTRVSTAEAARDAAAEAAKRATSSKKSTKAQGAARAPDEAGESDVLEFKPAVQDRELDTTSHPNIAAKPSRKNIHGSVSGSLDPTHSGNHESSAAVGVGSKSGKTHVYLETERSRSVVPTVDSPTR